MAISPDEPLLAHHGHHVYGVAQTSALSAALDKTPAVGGAGLPIASGAVTTPSYAADYDVVAAAAVRGF